MKPTYLPPKYEAALIAYIALYYNCDVDRCWKTIGELTETFGERYTGVVYRGHDANNPMIDSRTPFFSTSPNRDMAMLFVQRNWNAEGESVGNLFKIHLVDAQVLNTSKIKYRISDEVLLELKKLVGEDALIEKGDRTYTLKEYLPFLKNTLHKLVFERNATNDDEILVLNGGVFFDSAALTTPGYTERKEGRMSEYETWYSSKKRGGKARKTRRAKKALRRTTAYK